LNYGRRTGNFTVGDEKSFSLSICPKDFKSTAAGSATLDDETYAAASLREVFQLRGAGAITGRLKFLEIGLADIRDVG